eukprot:s356_g15.t1
MLAMVHPYLSVVVPHYKQTIARSICLLSILLSCDSVLTDFFKDQNLELLRWIEQLLIEILLLYLVAKGLWILFMNRVLLAESRVATCSIVDTGVRVSRFQQRCHSPLFFFFLRSPLPALDAVGQPDHHIAVSEGCGLDLDGEHRRRVVIPVTIMEDTFYPWKSFQWLVSIQRWATGLHRVSALKRNGYIEFHTNRWTGISWSIGHILHGQLQISSTLRMEEVHTVLEGAVRAVCRSHKTASVKHLLGGGFATVARSAHAEGKTISECIQSHAGDFIAHELSVAVHDQNVDLASAVRAAEAAAALRAARAAAREGLGAAGHMGLKWDVDFEVLEVLEVDLPSPPCRTKTRKKVLLLPRRWPRPRRPSRLNRAAMTMEDDTLFETEVEDEVDVEKQVWDLRKGCWG